jgi:hypothetical protein
MKEVAKAVELRNMAAAVTTVLVKLCRDFITPLSIELNGLPHPLMSRKGSKAFSALP